MFGYKLVGQFHVWSYPALGTYLFLAFGLLLVGGLWLTWWRGDSSSRKSPEIDSGGE
jgi:hypothetical protein